MKPELIDCPIFITGIERSGSSVIAKALKVCGAFSGSTTAMFENKKIKYLLNNYYNRVGLDVKGQYPIPTWFVNKTKDENIFSENWEIPIKKIVYDEGYAEDVVWFYKSSKIAQTWKYWLTSFPHAKFIIVRRNSADVLNSCMKTGFMKAFDSETNRQMVGAANSKEGWSWWIATHKTYFLQMKNSQMNCRVIWPELLIRNNFEQLKELIEWVGLKYNKKVEVEILSLLKKSKI